jgi:hypothetical protein
MWIIVGSSGRCDTWRAMGKVHCGHAPYADLWQGRSAMD